MVSLRIFFISSGAIATISPRVLASCHVCIETDGKVFRIVKNRFTSTTGEWQPIEQLDKFINTIEELDNA